jgi:site-specific DNA-methyltransferase (adenine-specific)
MIHIEDIKLIKGDCLKEMDKLIKQNIKVNAIITDIPYGTTACKWDEVIPFDEMWERIKLLRKDIHTPTVLFGSEPFSSRLRMSNTIEYRHEWYWNKINAGNFVQVKHHPLKIFENILVFSKAKVNYYPQMIHNSEQWTKILKAKHKNKKESSLTQTVDDKYFIMASGKFKSETDESLAYPKNEIIISKFSNECNSRHRVHPTQKPVKLIEYLVQTYTNEGNLVLDFTMGSGTTGVACKNLNRRFIGIEKEQKYYNIAVNRISNINK